MPKGLFYADKRTLDEFTLGYIYAILSTEEDSRGRVLEDRYNVTHFNPEVLNKLQDDCEAFQERFSAVLEKLYKSPRTDGFPKFSAEHAGYDYWLARNGKNPHFVDKGIWEVAQEFRLACTQQPQAHIKIVDDELNIEIRPQQQVQKRKMPAMA